MTQPEEHWPQLPKAPVGIGRATVGAAPAQAVEKPPTTTNNNKSAAVLIVPALIGCAVSAVIGVYANAHEPSNLAINVAGFSSPLTVKVWLATLAALLAVVQLVSALVMYGKVPGVKAPSWIGTLHRWSGRMAFLATVPVAMHCIYALGFQTYDTRVLVHSVLGTMFFGAFTVKMLTLTKKNTPGWALPLLGGLVFTGLSGLFITSAAWYFSTSGFQI
jgi:hypothetical protein